MGQALNVKLYLITDEECLQGKDLFRTVEEALQAGVTLVQYREKNGQGGAMLQKAVALRTLCHQYGVPPVSYTHLCSTISGKCQRASRE